MILQFCFFGYEVLTTPLIIGKSTATGNVVHGSSQKLKQKTQFQTCSTCLKA